jgi:hypothetical protein
LREMRVEPIRSVMPVVVRINTPEFRQPFEQCRD